jgi:hypothetical protein
MFGDPNLSGRNVYRLQYHLLPKLGQGRNLPDVAPDGAKEEKRAPIYKHSAPQRTEENSEGEFAFLPRVARRRPPLRLFDEPRQIGSQFRVKLQIGARYH